MTKLNSGNAKDIIALRNIGVLYCRGIDRRDIDLLRILFHPDATMDYGAEHYLGNIGP
jgi:SnoaL-like domain